MGKLVPVRPDPKLAMAIVESLKEVTTSPREGIATLILALRFINRPPYRTNEPTNKELAAELQFAMENMLEFTAGTVPPISEAVN